MSPRVSGVTVLVQGALDEVDRTTGAALEELRDKYHRSNAARTVRYFVSVVPCPNGDMAQIQESLRKHVSLISWGKSSYTDMCWFEVALKADEFRLRAIFSEVGLGQERLRYIKKL